MNNGDIILQNTKSGRGFLKFFGRIIESFLIGIISGLFVTYLLLGPKLNIQELQYEKDEYDIVKIIMTFQNIGNSTAYNVNLDFAYVLAKDMENPRAGSITSVAIPNEPIAGGMIEPGDRYDYTLILKKPLNEKHFFWICLKYSDLSLPRGSLFKLLGSPLKKIRWAKYNPSKNKLEKIPLDEMEKLDNFKKIINVTQKEGFIREKSEM